jgi:ElaB/YqjD/DUF883 family membrane-anchored ribosome-binding protein
MRNAAGTDAKDLANQIALLRSQLEELAETVNGGGKTLLHRGEEALDDTLRSAREVIAKYGESAKAMAEDAARLKQRASDTIVHHAEERPFTTLAALAGIGFLAGWLLRRR